MFLLLIVGTVFLSTEKVSCSVMMDYGYLGNYDSTANSTYESEYNLVISGLMELTFLPYRSDKCYVDFSYNLAAFGSVSDVDSTFYPPDYTDDFAHSPSVPSSPISWVSLCRAIDKNNAYDVPEGTENSCLIFISGQSAADFAKCKPVNTDRFNYIFGVGINATGISTVTPHYVSGDFWLSLRDDLLDMIKRTIKPAAC